MKLSWGFFFSSLSCTATAARPSVSPNTARLIVAQRLGLSRFHSIEHPDAESIRHINAYGGRQPKLFGAKHSDRSRAHLLIWREDGLASEGATVIISDGEGRVQDFEISSAPSPADNARLINDFITQAESLPAPADPKKRTYMSALDIEHLAPANKLHTHNEYLNILRLDKSDNMSTEDLQTLFGRVQGSTDGLTVTFVTMPASSHHSKRAANPWGTYSLPAVNRARRENPEMILSSNPVPSSSPAPPVPNLEDFPVYTNQANTTGPVRGILPSCFDTMAACEKRTHGCSGHGECKLLHKGRGSGSEKQTIDCYGCACSPTIVEIEKGMETARKVTYWGGPACQKKDISTEFWLFVVVGVTLAFLISSGIGMLYSMGAEELPSVIGAGVSGPVRK
ncbi:hypothetical protein CC86DRAFT_342169 [Ophiobolus disseminans]|uniref:Uncharacterized protein n=1 Tax=Ophiobolus disseminans TaxID=1469910 RepID=A0A6A7ADU2_9PLEO|nr:hypothetical protein CC86DRAFT_342169 [Ophiobolus disseminans]